MNHHNRDYDGGSPNIPIAVGDRYYAQDMVRDGWQGLDAGARSAWGGFVKGGITSLGLFLYIAGLITKGTGDTLNVPAGKGLAWYQVRVPDAFPSVPPTSKLEDIATPVDWTAQSNMSLPSATLDGVSTNYIKVRYAETDGNSRTRAKKAGTYAYERVPSFSFLVSTTAPGKYDVVLGTLVGTSGGSFTINTYRYLGELRYPVDDGATVAAGDILILTKAEKVRKYARIVQGPSSVQSGFSMARIDDDRFIATYLVSNDYQGVVIRANSDGTFTLGSAIALTTTVPASGGNMVAMLSDTTGILVYRKSSNQYIYGIAFTVGASPSLSITAVGSETGIQTAVTTSTTPWVRAIDSSRALLTYYSSNAGNAYACNLSVSGTTLTPSANTSIGAFAGVTSFVPHEILDRSSTAIAVASFVYTGPNLSVHKLTMVGAGAPSTSATTISIPAWNSSNHQMAQFVYAAGNSSSPHRVVILSGQHNTSAGQGIIAHAILIGSGAPEVDTLKRWPLPFPNTVGNYTPPYLNRIVSGANPDAWSKDNLCFHGQYMVDRAGSPAFAWFFAKYTPVPSIEDEASWGTESFLNIGSIFLLNDRMVIGRTAYFYLINSPAAVVGIAADDHGGLICNGQIATLSSLTPGATYYVGATGVVSLTKSAMRIGRALSTTELLVDIGVEV